MSRPAGSRRWQPGQSAMDSRMRRRPVHEHLRPAVDAQRRTDGIGWLPGPPPGSNTGGRTDRRVRQSSRRFPRRIASGEGAHGPDRSRLAMCCQGRTSRQRKAIRRAPAPSTPCLPRKDDRHHAQGSHLLYTRRARQALPCVTRTSSISDAAYRVRGGQRACSRMPARRTCPAPLRQRPRRGVRASGGA